MSAVLNSGLEPVYRLTTALGRQIESTANHPFYTFDGWRLLEQLKPGDRIAVPRKLPVEGNTEWFDHEVIALGHLIAEGNLCHPHSVYHDTQDNTCLTDYVQAAEAFDNVQCSVALHKGTLSVYAKRIDRELPTGSCLGPRSWAFGARTPAPRRCQQRSFPCAIDRLHYWAGSGPAMVILHADRVEWSPPTTLPLRRNWQGRCSIFCVWAW